MKKVEFKALKKKRKSKKCLVLCFGGVFKKCMIVFSILLAVLVCNLITKTFFKDITVSVKQYVESFVSLM